MTLKERLEKLAQAMIGGNWPAWDSAATKCAQAYDLIPRLALALQDCAVCIEDTFEHRLIKEDEALDEARAVLAELESRLK